MGLFSTKKQLFVSSVVYNMAGPEVDRPDYLKTTLIGSIIGQTNTSLGEKLTNSYLHGPGIQLRSYGRWARLYGFSDLVGQTTGALTLSSAVDHTVLAGLIPHAVGEEVVLQTAEIGVPDYTYWVDRYMVANHPELLESAYTADFNEATNLISITLPDTTVESFTPTEYEPTGRYLYASYNLATGETAGALDPGEEVSLDPEEDFPEITGWTENSLTETPHTVTLVTRTTTVVSYSDARPDETTVTETEEEVDYTEFAGEWERTTYQGWDPATSRTHSLREVMVQNQTGAVETATEVSESEEILPGSDPGPSDDVTKTTTVTVETDSLVLTRTYQVDTQEITLKGWSPLQMLIYRHGSGDAALDALFTASTSQGSFLPYIPVRINNEFVSDSHYADIYPRARRATRRAMRASFNKIVGKIADNESLGDIDYAYMVFGVALNVQENACKRYLYEFFQEIMLGQDLTGSAYEAWKLAWEDAKTQQEARDAWFLAQGIPDDPLFGTPEPPAVVYPPPPSYSLQVASGGRPDINYDMTVSWSGITESVGSGLAKPGAKKGELWFEDLGSETFTQYAWVYAGGGGETDATWQYLPYEAHNQGRVKLTWQDGNDSWRSLEITGLKHRNLIYGGKAVEITAAEALADAEESGFIIPIHEEVFRRMPLKDSTQMSTACCFLVFNCYQVVKQKWYQTTWFKVLLVVAIIIITIVTGGAGASSAGLLGTNAAVGAAMGFTGTAAVIAGAVANALAAMLLAQLIQMGSTAIFGEKVGAIVGAIAAVVALQVGTSLANGGSLATGFGEMMKAENLLKLTVAAGEGYQKYVQADIQDMMQKTQELVEDYTAQSRELTRQYAEMFGDGRGGVLNPLQLLDSARVVPAETSDSFLSRTLMTGSEIAEMSNTMLSEFSSITLSTNLAI